MGGTSSNSRDTEERDTRQCLHPFGGICSNCSNWDHNTTQLTDELRDNLEALCAAAKVTQKQFNSAARSQSSASSSSALHRQLVTLLFLLTLSSEEVLQEPHPLVSCCFDLPAARDAIVCVLSSHRAVWELSMMFGGVPAAKKLVCGNGCYSECLPKELQTVALARLTAAPDTFVHSVVSRIHAAFVLEDVFVDVLAILLPSFRSSELAGLVLQPRSGPREGGTTVFISGPGVGSNQSGLQLLYNQHPCVDQPFSRTLHNYEVIIPHMLVSVRTPSGCGQAVIHRPGLPHSAIFQYDAVRFNGHVECRCNGVFDSGGARVQSNSHLRYGVAPSTARFHWTELDFGGNWSGQNPEDASLEGVEPVEVLPTEKAGVVCLLSPMKWTFALHHGWPWFVRVRLATFAAVAGGQLCWPVMEMLLVERADLCLLEDERKLSANEYTKRGDQGCCSECKAVIYC